MKKVEDLTTSEFEDALKKAYDFACEWITDEDTAALIIAGVLNPYSHTCLMSSDEWYSKTPDEWESEFLNCLIGEDVALDYFVTALF